MPFLHESGVASTPSWYGQLSGNTRSVVRSAGAIVLHVDSAVTTMHGLTWLTDQRDSSLLRQLAELQAESVAEGWSAEQLVAARIAIIRPRRSEINALGREYLRALAPGVIDAAHRIRRSGIAIGLSTDVAVEALFGVATALGVTPEDIHAPAVRFDALGAFAGCDVARRGRDTATLYRASAMSGACVFVGARPPEFGVQPEDAFIRFTGIVHQEAAVTMPVLDSARSFSELASLVGG